MSRQVTICCAEEDEPEIAPVVAELFGHGILPELIAGVDEDAWKLGQAVDDAAEPGVYVVIGSERLDRRGVRRLEGIFGARKGPADELLIVQFDPQAPRKIVQDIRRAVGAEPPPERLPDADSVSNLRDFVRPAPAPKFTGGVEVSTDPASSGKAPKLSPSPSSEARRKEQKPDPAPAPARSHDAPRRTDPRAETGSDRPVPRPSTAPNPALRSPAPKRGRSPWLLLLVFLAVAGAGAVLLVMENEETGRQANRGAPGLVQSEVEKPEEGTAEADAAPPPEPTPEELERRGRDQEAVRVGKALAAGNLRALDELILIPEVGSDITFRRATERCADKEVEGLSGFRLPTRAELKDLRRGHMLKRSRYWSSELGKDEKKVWILDIPETGAPALVSRYEGRAHAICVRSRLPE